MDTIDPAAFKAAVDYERAAIIRLIKAHAADCERRGARSLGHDLALVGEIEDAMQHDRAHVEALEGPPQAYSYRGRDCRNRTWYVGGQDVEGNSAGVLEWCNSEADAKERMGIMARYPQFIDLSIGEWEDP